MAEVVEQVPAGGDPSRQEAIDARKSVSRAHAAFLKAKEESRSELLVNEFARNEDGDVEKQGKAAKRASAKGAGKWLSSLFSRKPTASSTRELQLWNGENLHWEAVATGAVTEVKDLCVTEGKWSPASKVFWTRPDVTLETQVGPDGLLLLRVKADLAVEPRAMLALQKQFHLRGQADPELIYMREHWRFRFGRTVVAHSVRKHGKLSSPRDFSDLITHEEQPDGGFVVAEQSIAGFLPTKVVKGAVRGVTRVRGMTISPKVLAARGLFGKPSEGCHVTYVLCVDPKGWLPKSVYNMWAGKAAAHYLLNCETLVHKMSDEDRDLLFDDDE